MTTTPNKAFNYPAHGGAVNAWDAPLNANFDQLDQNLGGHYSVVVGSSIVGVTFSSTAVVASSTASTITFASSIALNLFYPVSGTLTQNLTLIYPSVGSFYIISDGTSGGFTISAKIAASATTVPIRQTELIVTEGSLPSGVTQTQAPEFVSGTALLFPQAAAPSGWTQDATVNDRMIRVTSGAGAGTGGSWTISGLTVDTHILTVAEIPSHTHTVQAAQEGTAVAPTGGSGKNYAANNNLTTSAAGSGAGHTHGLTADGSWRPQYYNVIRAVKN